MRNSPGVAYYTYASARSAAHSFALRANSSPFISFACALFHNKTGVYSGCSYRPASIRPILSPTHILYSNVVIFERTSNFDMTPTPTPADQSAIQLDRVSRHYTLGAS